MTVHYVAAGSYVRGADGRVQTRSGSLRLRLEPALLDALKRRARDAGYVRPAPRPAVADPLDRTDAERVCADLDADYGRDPAAARRRLEAHLRYETRPDVRTALALLEQEWRDDGRL